MAQIKQWKNNRITLQPNQVYQYNSTSERTNIFQIINRVASGGGVIFVDTEPNVSATSYQLRIDAGSSQNLVLPYETKVLYLKTDSLTPLVITIVEITSDDISFTFGAAQLVNISGNVQVQQPVTVAGTVSISGEVEVKNDTGAPIPVAQTGAIPAGGNAIGTVGVTALPALPAGGNVIGTANQQALSATVLNVASAAITTTTTSANLNVGTFKELALDVNISALAGTTPSYTLTINRKGADGIYYPIYTGSAQTAIAKISLSLGVGAANNLAFGNIIQIVETVAGTTPSITRSLSVIGK